MLTLLRFFLLFAFGMQLWAAEVTPYTWYSLDAQKHATINVELFFSSTCPHCHKADAFFHSIEPQMPWLKVNRNYINENKDALILFNKFLMEQNLNDFAVPSVFFCNSRWVGFDSAETTGNNLLNGLNYCKQQLELKGTLSKATVNVLKRWANANKLNSGILEQPSKTHYMFIVALLDIGNPCGLFCLAGFLALIFIQSSQKNQWRYGGLYIVAIAMAHYLQQTQTSAFFQLLPWLRIVALLIGIFTFYVVFLYYKQRNLKPSLLYLWAFLLAFLVQSYQQTCVMNWSYIFQQWLDNQLVSAGQKTILQLIYQMIYVAPLVIVVLAYTLIQKIKNFAVKKPFLERLGLIYLSVIAAFLIIQPMASAHYLTSFLSLSVGFIGALILNRYQENNKN